MVINSISSLLCGVEVRFMTLSLFSSLPVRSGWFSWEGALRVHFYGAWFGLRITDYWLLIIWVEACSWWHGMVLLRSDDGFARRGILPLEPASLREGHATWLVLYVWGASRRRSVRMLLPIVVAVSCCSGFMCMLTNMAIDILRSRSRQDSQCLSGHGFDWTRKEENITLQRKKGRKKPTREL